MLDQLVAPFADAAHRPADVLEDFGDAGIEHGHRDAAIAAGAQAPAGRDLLHGEQGTDPDAGARAALAHLRGEAGHVGKAAVAVRIGAGAIGVGIPAHIDHHEGAVGFAGGCGFGQHFGIAQDVGGAEVAAVGVIPVIAAIDGGGGEARLLAEHPAKLAHGLEGSAAGARLGGADDGGFEAAIAEERAGATVAEIEPQRNSGGVGLPEADCGGSGLHTIGVRGTGGGDAEVPGHGALGDAGAPFEIAVAAFPVIAQVAELFGHGSAPAQADVLDFGAGRGDGDGHLPEAAGAARFGGHSTPEPSQRSPERVRVLRPAEECRLTTSGGRRTSTWGTVDLEDGVWANASGAAAAPRKDRRFIKVIFSPWSGCR